ncbi:type II toxin-antitoxin system prevent-host-death family antitoxin [Spirulina sp. CS-785/01]|uniref:type II toxin-antitoxin system Phd/YefM family antitoxin n=1 Tax=Spirulina sp. CS-785/01 TaxID=3021716 RepID=UPI00232D0259|nr:type II toxin-antitoxin system prevent-host-death family antitoxin [Spirulina sp. CS-785/01]MDB9313331.1 type II toxin-antitoxin system prevent-host-death family antitoxin [Spirulina sp. CS-785/01]
MYQVTLEYAKQHLEEILERAKTEPGGVVIVQNDQNFVLMSQDELECWTETQELLQDPHLLSDIEQAHKDYEAGDIFTMEQALR